MAERPRPHGQEQPAEAALDERAQALQELLAEVLQQYQPQVGATLDTPQIIVRREDILAVCRTLKEEPRLSFKLPLCIAGVDYEDHFQMVYVLLSLEHQQTAVVKVDVPYDDPRLASVTPVWRGADWYEREAHDLLGVSFDGHPDLRPLILYEGFEGYPGRRAHPFNDYQEF